MARKTIEVIVRGVCVVQGRLLLCQSQGASNTYLPGGHVEFREHASEALEREIFEELGLKARAGRFLGCCEHTFRQQGRWHAEINLVLALTVPGLRSDHPPAACEDWIAFRWCPLRALGAAGLEPAPLRTLIPAWLKRPGFASGGQGWQPHASR